MPRTRSGGARERHRSSGWRSPALAGLVFLLSGLSAEPALPPAGAGWPVPRATSEVVQPAAVQATTPATSPAGTRSLRAAPVPSAARPGDLAALPAGPPTSLSVPDIDVEAPIVTLGLNADNTLEVPTSTADTGWYRYGPRPGEEGPAVIAGHVDSRSGPGVFYRLRDLEPGHVITVGYDGGLSVVFRVTRVERHPKDDFPTAHVYGPTSAAELRLITCGGDFDRASRHYRDNVIVFAELDGR